MRTRMLSLGAVAAIAVLLVSSKPADACSRILWNTNGQAVVSARTMDLFMEDKPRLVYLPRGIARRGAAEDKAARWTSKYASTVVTSLDAASDDGMNEAGLGAHLLYLHGTKYQPADKRPVISNMIWMQYALDNFATVAEALEGLKQVRVVAKMAAGHDWPLHMAREDASGDSAFIEYIKGKMVVHHGKEFTVMTNEPPMAKQLANLKRYKLFEQYGSLSQVLQGKAVLLYMTTTLATTCRVPTCRQPAWRCDLDHRDPYNHHHPGAGGPTAPANIDPLCRTITGSNTIPPGQAPADPTTPNSGPARLGTGTPTHHAPSPCPANSWNHPRHHRPTGRTTDTAMRTASRSTPPQPPSTTGRDFAPTGATPNSADLPRHPRTESPGHHRPKPRPTSPGHHHRTPPHPRRRRGHRRSRQNQRHGHPPLGEAADPPTPGVGASTPTNRRSDRLTDGALASERTRPATDA